MTDSKNVLQQALQRLFKDHDLPNPGRAVPMRRLLVDLFDGDHNAALFLQQVLYWTERATLPNGWFYKPHAEWHAELGFSPYQVNRVIYGDPRTVNRKRNLSDVGLEVKKRRLWNGTVVNHYRLDLERFAATLADWLHEQGKAVEQADVLAFFRPVTAAHATTPTTTDPTPAVVPNVARVSVADVEPLVTPQTPSIASLPTVEALINADQTAAEVWRQTWHQLQKTFDRSQFHRYIRPLQLVDFDGRTLTLVTPHRDDLNGLRGRLMRDIQGKVRHVAWRDNLEVNFVSAEDWHNRHTQRE